MTATEQFILDNASADVLHLALRRPPEGVDLRWALQQIEGLQIAKRKLPSWAETEKLWFPPKLNLEQCSSEATASYKKALAARLISASQEPIPTVALSGSSPMTDRPSTHLDKPKTFVDLTGGFGVDFATMAPLFEKASYVESNEELCRLARHNMPLLGLGQAEVRNMRAEDVLAEDWQADVVMIDPARRDTAGRKTVLIEDCTPDVCALQELLRRHARYTIIKLSPMLDITAALRSLSGVSEVHVVGSGGECKELLLVLQSSPVSDVPIFCAEEHNFPPPPLGEVGRGALNPPLGACDASLCEEPSARLCRFAPQRTLNTLLPSGRSVGGFSIFTFHYSSESASPLLLADRLGTYIYEPSATVLKAGAYRTLCTMFPGLAKLATTTHLYTSDELIADFPGRIWRLLDSATFAKADLRRLLSGIKAAELSTRGFPMSVAALRRQLRLREGGTAHFIATTLADGSRRLLKVELISLH